MTGKRMVKNSIFMVGNVAAGGIILFFSMILIGRHLGKELFGDFALVLAIASILQLFCDGGVIKLTVREMARHREDTGAMLAQTKTFIWMMNLLIGLVLLLLLPWLRSDWEFRVAYLVMGMASLVTVNTLLYAGVMQAHEDMVKLALFAIGHKLVLLACLLVALFLDGGLIGVALVHLIANVLHWLALYLMVHRRFGWVGWRWNSRFNLTLFKESLPLGAAMVVRKLTIHLDILMLGVLATSAAVGVYSSAYRVLQMVELAIMALCSVLFPAFSRLFMQDKLAMARLYRVSVRWALILTLPLSLLMCFFGELILVTLYGNSFAAVGKVTEWLGLAFVFLSPGTIAATLMTAIDRQHWLLRMALFAALFNGSINLYLIPKFGAEGAAIGTLCTELLSFTIGIVLLERSGVKTGVWLLLLRLGIIMSVSYGAMLLYHPYEADWVDFGLLVVSFILMAFLTGLVQLGDFKLLKPGKRPVANESKPPLEESVAIDGSRS